ncbi:thiamine phosphate synthase [Roseobacter sp. N2S]|uniref:thiamine phosphate synthase n=1 Tax=Roseobacter sp. N2S TaxID=2663844 RepID=UPI0028592D0B|nr:thiamine phosphate synthase [Roseobacter sp. N2S]MDR6266851.1 thiamine-phosphate pyrophosphorylase [Roseobacter sp. N2S]
MKLDRFYPIFDSADWLERLVPLGIKLVQLRIKDASPAEIRDHIRRAKAVCADRGCTLIINDYWQIAIDEGCDYIHLGQEDLDDADIAAIRGAGLRLGISTHDKAELARALELNPDYIALGPIYPTILKKMKWHEQGIEKLTTWRERIGTTPLIAIGGMNIDRAAGAFAAGADVVAAVTDITLHANPEDRIRAWLAATR